MSTSMPDWKGLLKWSLEHSDGTKPAKQVSEADRKWFEEACKEAFVDEVAIMRQINAFLLKESEEGVTEEEMVEVKEGILEELQDIVESIDRARDLKQIGGFPVLMDLLDSTHEGLRWRAAEVIATCVQNNPPVQDWALGYGALPKLLVLSHDPSTTCKTKALLALSCIARGNEAACNALRIGDGLATLCALVRAPQSKLSRKALQFLRHLLQLFPQEAAQACQLGAVEAAADIAWEQDDMDHREAALGLLLQTLDSPQVREKCMKCRSGLEGRLQSIQKLGSEDRDTHREEEQMLGAILKSLR